MSYHVWLRDLKTSETRRVIMPDSWIWEDGEGTDEYMWSEGHYSCDCMRQATFRQTKNDPPIESPCTHDGFPDGRFLVVSIKLEDGAEVYAEKE